MLFNSRNKAIVSRVLLTSWLAMLAGCNNGNAIEGLIGPDPQLKARVVREDSPQFTNSQVNAGEVEDRVEDNTSPSETEAPEVEDNTSPSETEAPGTENSEISLSESQPEPELPTDFPSFVPIYPQAKLQGAIPGAAINQGRAYWRSPDSARQIVTYYQQQLSAEGWELIQPFELNTQSNNQEAVALKDNLQITIKVPQSASNEESGLFLLSYQPVTPDTPAEVETPATIEEIETEKNNNSVAERNNSNTPDKASSSQSDLSSESNIDFVDLDEVPDQIRQYVEDVARLGILTPYTQNGNIDLTRFAPNEAISRGEYARWLIAANNKYYSDSPGKNIHVATKVDRPAFQDIKTSNPDFGAIQGLAEAGLVPSMLTDDSSKLLFQPDAPLKREDLVTWKVPLDTRKALPPATTEAIQESWGFQDAANIDSSALQALFADFQNGDRSNVGRVFGYTTLFQPKKPVTRAEAAASLWYFGFQGDGITAPEAAQLEE